VPTPIPTFSPTQSPTPAPTPSPTSFPTLYPTPFPTAFPTRFPTKSPTPVPTKAPTQSPTFDPLISTPLVVGNVASEDLRFGPAPQDTLNSLDNIVGIKPFDAEVAHVYRIQGETGQSIEFSGACGPKAKFGRGVAVSIYCRPNGEDDQYLDSFEGVEAAKLDCASKKPLNPISVPTVEEKEYLVVVYGFGMPASFELDVSFEAPTELSSGEDVFEFTASLGKIPSFYENLMGCGGVSVNLEGVDSAEVYTVFGEDHQLINFSALCKTSHGNKIRLYAYARDVPYDKDFGPTEQYYCGSLESLFCNYYEDHTSISFTGEADKQYLFVALARGVGDIITLEVKNPYTDKSKKQHAPKKAAKPPTGYAHNEHRRQF